MSLGDTHTHTSVKYLPLLRCATGERVTMIHTPGHYNHNHKHGTFYTNLRRVQQQTCPTPNDAHSTRSVPISLGYRLPARLTPHIHHPSLIDSLTLARTLTLDHSAKVTRTPIIIIRYPPDPKGPRRGEI